MCGELAMREPLLVEQLDPSQVEHAVLHRDVDLLAAAGAIALVERAHDADGEMQAGAAVADLRARHQRRALVGTKGSMRAPGPDAACSLISIALVPAGLLAPS